MSKQRMTAAMATGLVNPFGSSSPDGDALFASTRIGGERRAKGVTDAIEEEIFDLSAGPLALALGT